ncbi:MAG: PDZ domain-containing protein [Ignavibacteriales bacterium]|nr:PDZ domain-containing protein [Ignavibacteriales bacterium]
MFPLVDRAAPFIEDLEPGTPAAKAGLKRGDKILTINSENIASVAHVIEVISASPDKAVQVAVLRGKDTVQMAVTPKKMKRDREKLESNLAELLILHS